MASRGVAGCWISACNIVSNKQQAHTTPIKLWVSPETHKQVVREVSRNKQRLQRIRHDLRENQRTSMRTDLEVLREGERNLL